MSLRKRGGIWWVDVVAPNGERIRRTTGTASKALAQEFHDRLKSELWRIAKLGEKPQRTWNDAVVRWLNEKSYNATAKGDVNLRHYWASWHVQRGTPLFALQELDGWERPEMVRRYAHHAADHLAPYAERLCALRAVAAKKGRHKYGTKVKAG